MRSFARNCIRAAVAVLALASAEPCLAEEPLGSWNDSAAKRSIIAFVDRVTKQGSPDFVPPARRIATTMLHPWRETQMRFSDRQDRNLGNSILGRNLQL